MTQPLDTKVTRVFCRYCRKELKTKALKERGYHKRCETAVKNAPKPKGKYSKRFFTGHRFITPKTIDLLNYVTVEQSENWDLFCGLLILTNNNPMNITDFSVITLQEFYKEYFDKKTNYWSNKILRPFKTLSKEQLLKSF
ncbi:MAG: hypothetical protein HeimC3_31850 [Candidatus Heimdallarchaeota archaeon LC_3]|nr:MAG: hypothetical protein HeimC3_31850 [Candidatus Heimdallarchaeota archaeon LC_3]